MALSSFQALSPILRKLETRALLDQHDREAFLGLPVRLQKVEPSVFLVREGDRPDQSLVLISGFAFRHKLTESGHRQILNFHVAGDFMDLEGALLNIADHNIQTLTRCEVAFVPRGALRELLHSFPRLCMAMWIDTLIDASIFREWIVNVGRRGGVTRIAHLLCEFGRRLELTGIANLDGFELPMTQEKLADATGMTSVHVNRLLKQLAAQRLIKRTRRSISICDWERLRSLAGFSELYLHLDQVVRDQRADRALG